MSDPHHDPAEDAPGAGESAGPPVVDSDAMPCRHLRNNGMFLHTGGGGTPQPEESSSTVYWCSKTTTGFGPDDDMVGRLDCRNSSRSCYKPLY